MKAIITVNPKVLQEAEALDRERASGRIRGPLHGIPIALKDNIHTTDMPTTGGALAFDGYRPPYEATLTRLLREAGAVIIAKTVMTELANWVGGAPTPMPANYGSLHGFGFNPYDPRRDPREATNDGRPVARHRRIELRHRHDRELLGGERGDGDVRIAAEPGESDRARHGQADGRPHQPLRHHPDRRGPGHRGADGAHGDGCGDPARRARGRGAGSVRSRPRGPAGRPPIAITPPHLKRDGLKGARIGIPRAFFYDQVTPPGETAPRGGLNAAQAAAMAEVIEILKREGAMIVDPVVLPSVADPDPANNYLTFPICAGATQGKGADDKCTIV